MTILEPAVLLHGYAIFLRAGAFFLPLPLMGRPVPVLVRVSVALFLAVFLVPLTDPHPTLVVPDHLLDLLGLSLREVFFGFVMAYAVQLIIYLCQFAGRFLSTEIGLMQSNLFNPMAGEQSTILGIGMTMLSLVLIFTLDIHHLILHAFARSLSLMPAGAPVGSGASAENVVHGVGNIFLVAVQMSAPLIAVNFIVTLAFAILGRAVPTMNVLILSFPARILAPPQ